MKECMFKDFVQKYMYYICSQVEQFINYSRSLIYSWHYS